MTDPAPVPKLTPEQRKMVEDNIGLVGWAVSRWARFLPVDGGIYTQADAYQDATFGLMRAVVKFDPDKGYRFATYARFWLQQSITRGQGTFEGLSHRRIAAGVDAPEDHRRSVSLWSDTDCLLDILDSGVDLEAAAVDGMDNHARWLQVLGCRDTVCHDDLDRALWDVMLDPLDGRAVTVKAKAVAATFGLSGEGARRRWAAIRSRVVEQVEGAGVGSRT